jgi:hypothetical protein
MPEAAAAHQVLLQLLDHRRPTWWLQVVVAAAVGRTTATLD